MNVMVLGDLMLDRYTDVSSKRQAAEAQIPVWDAGDSEVRLGGAANVALNIRAIDPDALVSVAGICDIDLEDLLAEFKICQETAHVEFGMVKHRFVDDANRIVARVDYVNRFSELDVDKLVSHLKSMQRIFKQPMFDILIVSDYDKGTVTDESLSVCMEMAKGKPIIVDSKRKDIRMFSGADVLKLNEHEYGIQVANVELPAFERLFKNVVVTRGAKGAELRVFDSAKSDAARQRFVTYSEMFPVEEIRAVDVTGCGDTHTAAMAVSLCCDHDVRNAIRKGNLAARDVVSRFGTSVPQNIR